MYSFGHFKKIGLISIILLGIILFFIDPEYSAFIPKCPFRWFTGLDCPACGSQRAIHQLLHLNIKGAFGYNPFLILSLPYLMALVITQWFDPRNRLGPAEKDMPSPDSRQHVLNINHSMVDCPEYPTFPPGFLTTNHITR